MAKLSQRDERLIRLAQKGGKDSDLVLLNIIHELEDRVEALAKEHKEYMPRMMEMMTGKEIKFPEAPEVQKVEIKGAELVTIKGDKGDRGDVGPIGLRGESIIGPRGERGPIGLTGKDGKDGIDGKSIIGPVGPAGKDGKDGSPDTPKEIRIKLESLEEQEQLPIHAIKGLPDALKKINRSGGGNNFSRESIVDIDISTQLNGVLKTFDIQAVYNIISVNLSSWPYGSMRKTTDYTFTSTTITFTSTVDAETQLASGQRCIITAILA